MINGKEETQNIYLNNYDNKVKINGEQIDSLPINITSASIVNL